MKFAGGEFRKFIVLVGSLFWWICDGLWSHFGLILVSFFIIVASFFRASILKGVLFDFGSLVGCSKPRNVRFSLGKNVLFTKSPCRGKLDLCINLGAILWNHFYLFSTSRPSRHQKKSRRRTNIKKETEKTTIKQRRAKKKKNNKKQRGGCFHPKAVGAPQTRPWGTPQGWGCSPFQFFLFPFNFFQISPLMPTYFFVSMSRSISLQQQITKGKCWIKENRKTKKEKKQKLWKQSQQIINKMKRGRNKMKKHLKGK